MIVHLWVNPSNPLFQTLKKYANNMLVENFKYYIFCCKLYFYDTVIELKDLLLLRLVLKVVVGFCFRNLPNMLEKEVGLQSSSIFLSAAANIRMVVISYV